MPTLIELRQMISNGEITWQDVRDNGWMKSVTNRVGKVKQPKGGYVKPRQFEKIELPGGGAEELNEIESIAPSLMGLTVDYLTRVVSGTDPAIVFDAAYKGAANTNESHVYERLLSKVKGLDDASIESVVRLSAFDIAYRVGPYAYRSVWDIEIDFDTKDNIREMVRRSIAFLEEYGPKVFDGLTFEGGYTGYVVSGDGDFLTSDTLWDFKVSKNRITTKHTLQLLMYWRMGLHSIHPEYKSVKYLGIYNPRLNLVYRLNVDEIPSDVIDEVETEVIGY